MRIKNIQLAWFRGAADAVSLEPDCKSIAVYGENGSGKSCFVDAVEYVLNDGKIGHLAHEYGGKHQERAIPNTHKPKSEKTELKFEFKDDSELKIEIMSDGSSKSSGAESIVIDSWDYRRTVLRQDEVADFIRDTKGDKYSALLPLLGLHRMEVAAENLRQLAKSVEQQSKLKEIKAILKEKEAKRKATFGADSDAQIFKKIEEVHCKYCPDKPATEDPLSRCIESETAIERRIKDFSADQRRHLALQDAAEVNLKGQVDAVRAASAKLADSVELLIAEKLEVLESTRKFVEKIGTDGEIKCPACGRSIPVEDFQGHIQAERERLQDILGTFETRKASIATLCDAIKLLKSYLGKD